MRRLEKIWIEQHKDARPAIRLDWDDDYHNRIEIDSNSPIDVAYALITLGIKVSKYAKEND